MQQKLDEHNNFHHGHIESCECYPMTQKNWMGVWNNFNWPSPQSLKISWVKISAEAQVITYNAFASPRTQGKILDICHMVW
jgi:hypothetical protein